MCGFFVSDWNGKKRFFWFGLENILVVMVFICFVNSLKRVFVFVLLVVIMMVCCFGFLPSCPVCCLESVFLLVFRCVGLRVIVGLVHSVFVVGASWNDAVGASCLVFLWCLVGWLSSG